MERPEGIEDRSAAEIAREGFEAWNTNELAAVLEYIHPDLLWITSGAFPGLGESYSGHSGFREFWAEFTEPWETLELEIEDIFELAHDSVLMSNRFHARGRQGIEVDLPVINHMVMRDGKLWRFHAYMDWDQAIAGLGIEDPRGEQAPQ